MNPPIARYSDDAEKGPQSPDAFFARPNFGPPGPGYQAVTVYQPSVEAVQGSPRNLRRRRFWHFIVCTFLFIIALHTFLETRTRGEIGYYFSHGDYKTGPSKCEDVVNWTTNSLDHPYEYPFHAQTSVTFPLSALDMFFVSEGLLQHGDFEVSQDLDNHSDKAVVDIHVSYRVPDALDEATVCRMHPEADEWGVGIFTPLVRSPHRERHLKFHVHLRLPAVDSSEKVLKINSLTTDLPLFVHHLPELASVYFQKLKLHATNTPINADLVAGDLMIFEASNAAIHGTFNASSSLVLKTTNAPINVHVNLMNADERFTTLTMRTSNGRIDGNISLASNTSDSTKGKYWVSARTANAPLRLAFVDAPVDSTLTLEADTANFPAEVSLHKTFEGKFDISSSMWWTPEVQWHPVEDPAKRERKRQVSVGQVARSHVRGNVAWDEDGKNRGEVTLKTSNSPVRLFLD
ncbi:hypothetical protein C8Q80DRAFT_1095853 [Daedaleopsis nitida]|nr:hypothetical protein C8Q80DRAFT_1095853 [Daedaleopsis nitida]